MTFHVRMRSRAREDIRDARDWYERQSPGLGDEFGRELAKVFARLETEPLIYQAVHREIRRALTRRFPYAVYYLVDKDRVNVFRVLHAARDPREIRR